MNGVPVSWDSAAPKRAVVVEEIDYFTARGMTRVYGRGDQFGKRPSFNMDIWKTSDGRLLMRCWSRSNEIDGRSFEIKGVDTAALPLKDKDDGFFLSTWIPKAVRESYQQWIQDEL
jgi:hypothetical protein